MKTLALLCLVGCQAGSGGDTLVGHVRLEGADDHSGVVVTLVGAHSGVTRSAADGSYQFEDVSPGTWLVSAAADATAEGLLSVPSDGRSVPDLVFHPVGSLEGRVTRAGAAVGNAGIVVLAAGSASLATSDDSGAFHLSGLAPGRYQLNAFASGFLPGIARDLEVVRGGHTDVPQMDLQPAQTGGPEPGQIKGQLQLTGLDDASGVQVTLEGTVSQTTTDAQGHFALPNPPDGIYALSFEKDMYRERVPGVLAIPDATGFYVDGALFPMMDSTLVLARGRRQLAASVIEARLSPHGDFILARQGDPTQPYNVPANLVTLPSAGGAPTTIASRVYSFAFSPDGDRVAYLVGPDGNYAYDLYTAPVGGGASLLVRSGITGYFSYTPDGSAFLTGGAPYSSELWVVPSGGGSAIHLASSTRDPVVLPGGKELLVMANCLNQYYGSYPCDLQRAPLDGSPPVTLAQNVLIDVLSPAKDRAVFSQQGIEVNTWNSSLLSLDSGVITPVFEGLNPSGFTFTPDGTHLVATATVNGQPTDLYVTGLAGGTPTLLATHASYYSAHMSPGGTLMYLDPNSETSDLRAVPVTGGAIETLIADGIAYPAPFQFSPKGAWVAVMTHYAPASQTVTLSLRPAEGGTLRTLADGVLLRTIKFSDDDSQIAFAVDDGHLGTQGSLQVAPTAGGAARALADGVRSVERFSPTGVNVLYHANDQMSSSSAGTLWSVPAAGGAPHGLITRPSASFFVGDDLVATIRSVMPSPFHFQNGLYLLEAE
jgi:hypothetical protein